MQRYKHLSVAIPMMCERDNVPALLEALRAQECRDFTLYCCVNNEEGCDAETYEDNRATVRLLQEVRDMPVYVMDRCSEGRGWTGRQKGVGWARKLLFEQIMADSSPDEIMVSLDADTSFGEKYLSEILHLFNQNPQASALSVPYYHPLSGIEEQDRAMLRYECYMRHYHINMRRIGSPYAFTALGSAMAFPAWAYRRVGGITPLQGGEDFYLLQKFAKTGTILQALPEKVYPQGRKSSRVPFGTGPAIAKGMESMERSYPFYPKEGFDLVGETYQCLPQLYDNDVVTPMTEFLEMQLATRDVWSPLRKNFKKRELFVHACHERIDGLRILQFLKTQLPDTVTEETNMRALRQLCDSMGIVMPADFSFYRSPLTVLDGLRNALADCQYRQR